jgi:hypothetical protein
MRKLLLMVALFGLFCVPLFATDYPTAEAYGGYQYLHATGTSLNGFTGAGEFSIGPTFSIVGDFGYGKGDASVKDVLFFGGPRMSYRGEKIRLFGHILFGADHISGGTTTGVGAITTGSSTGFAMTYGGGIDISITSRISIRPAQLDLIRVRQSAGGGTGFGSIATWQNMFRYSAGLSFKFGSKSD